MVALAGEAEMAEWLVIVVIMVIASGWLARRALRRLLASRRPPRRRARLGTVRHLLGIVGLLLVVAAIGLEAGSA